MRNWIFGIVAVFGLSACSEVDPKFAIEPQMWEDVVVEIQTRPAPPRPGMNEFLIIATLERGKPVHNMIVSVRTSPGGEWRQAIQDGHSGVYRRAMPVTEEYPALQVELRRKRTDEGGVLEFPIVFE